MRRSLWLPVAWFLAAGCAYPLKPSPPPLPPPSAWLPASGLITQRAVLTARGRQFTLTGYLAVSETDDRRLVLLETFGPVMADVLLKADGRVYVMESSRMFPPKWIRRYVAADLRCLFGAATVGCTVSMPEPTRFVLKRRFYSLDVRVVDVKAGPQPAAMFDETRAPRQ